MWLVLQWSSKEDTRLVFIKRFTFKFYGRFVYAEASVQRETPRVQLHVGNITHMFTARKRSWGKVMFLQACVCSQRGISGHMSFLENRYLWYQVPSGGGMSRGVGISQGHGYLQRRGGYVRWSGCHHMYGQQAGGMHPTGMHSCLCKYALNDS